ncbi:MAG TPA: hypothetical protein VFZ06_01390 [Acidimicrobiia bacterium]|nr:hypothetical protein [Acidimicrobiia bacterium]
MEPLAEKRRQKIMRKILPLVFLAASMLFLASPAHGCSCMVASPEQMLEFGPIAFVGTMSEVVPNGNDHTLIFDVDTVLAGEVPAQVEVVTANNSAACGIDANVGTRMAIFANDDQGFFTSNLCSTTDADTAIKALGPGTPPSAATSPSANFDWQAVGLGAGALVLVASVWLMGRRRFAN